MKTFSENFGKVFLVAFLAATMSFQSCVVIDDDYGIDGRDGNAWVSLDYGEEVVGPPDYITTGGLTPSDVFYWGQRYHTYPGTYLLKYEYVWHYSDYDVTEYYETYVDIWIELGEEGGRGYDGYDGMDTFFNIILYSDGTVDRYEELFYKKDIVPKVELKENGAYKMKLTHKLKKREIVKKGEEPKIIEY